jgi:hypothetical protein
MTYCRRCAVKVSAFIEPEPFAGESYVVLCYDCWTLLDTSYGYGNDAINDPDLQMQGGDERV